jgi:hypothetical protein
MLHFWWLYYVRKSSYEVSDFGFACHRIRVPWFPESLDLHIYTPYPVQYHQLQHEKSTPKAIIIH